MDVWMSESADMIMSCFVWCLMVGDWNDDADNDDDDNDDDSIYHHQKKKNMIGIRMKYDDVL